MFFNSKKSNRKFDNLTLRIVVESLQRFLTITIFNVIMVENTITMPCFGLFGAPDPAYIVVALIIVGFLVSVDSKGRKVDFFIKKARKK
ncbi:hypothetical protein GCM10027051_28070 [Niabella terrae]